MALDRPQTHRRRQSHRRWGARASGLLSIAIATGLAASCHRATYVDPDGRAIRKPPFVASIEDGWIVVDTSQGSTRAVVKLQWQTSYPGLHFDPGALTLWTGSTHGLEPIRRSVSAPTCRRPARRRSGCDATAAMKRECPQTNLPPEDRCVHEVRAVFLLDAMPEEGEQIVLRMGGKLAVLHWRR